MRRPPLGAGLAGAALLIAVVTLVGRLLGFARFVVFAHTVGPTCLGDTYATANVIPNIVFDVVAGGALSTLVIPVLAGPVASGDRRAVDRTASALLSWVVLGLLPVAVAGVVLARPLDHLLVGDGHPGCAAAAEVDVGARMLVVFMPQVLLYGVGVVLTGIVQAHRRFLGPALGPLLSSAVVIGVYLTFHAVATKRDADVSTLSRAHELLLAGGTTLGVAALVLPLLVPARRTGVRLRPTLRFPPGVAAVVARMGVSGAAVLGSQQLATAAVVRLANDRGTDGAVVLYNLGWAVFLLPWAVIAVPLATSVFPALTAAWQGADRARYAATTANALRVVVAAGAAAAVVMATVSGLLARVVVLGSGRGAPTVLAHALLGFAPGVVGFGALAVLSRALYAQGDSRTPAAATSVGWLLAVVVAVPLAQATPRDWTVGAIGVGVSTGMTVAAVWLGVSLRRSAGPASVEGVPRTGAACAVGVLLAGALAGGLARVWGTGTGGVARDLVAAVTVGAVAASVHLAVLSRLDPEATASTLARIGRP